MKPYSQGSQPPPGRRGDRRGGPRSGRPEVDKEKAARIADLESKGIPRLQAAQIASGRRDLNDVIQDLARKDRIAALIKRYDFPASLATQIAIGHADLDNVLEKRRREAYMLTHEDFSILEKARSEGSEVTLALHGRTFRRVRILTVDPYEIDIEDVQGGQHERIHKLEIKFVFSPDEWKVVRKVLKFDRDLRSKESRPIARPQDRYTCSNRRLFALMETAHRILVTVLEGEQLLGTVKWIAQYEFGVEVRSGVVVAVMRHALADLREE